MKVIIDTDAGIDDAMAIQLAFAHPDLDVLGLTTVFGNVHVRKATLNALALVGMAGAGCPVAEGAAVPLGDRVDETGLPALGPAGRADLRDAARLITRTVRDHPGAVTLVAIGPLTNIAMALRREPEIVRLVDRVVVMGGAVERRGNVTEWAEFNIWRDPHAAVEVLSAPWPVTLVGLDVTERTRCTPADLARLAEEAPGICTFLNQAARAHFGWDRGKGVDDGFALHDPCAVLAAVEPRLFGTREVPISVVTEGEQMGRTITDPASGTPVRVCMQVDAVALLDRFLSVLAIADGRCAGRLVEGGRRPAAGPGLRGQ